MQVHLKEMYEMGCVVANVEARAELICRIGQNTRIVQRDVLLVRLTNGYDSKRKKLSGACVCGYAAYCRWRECSQHMWQRCAQEGHVVKTRKTSENIF